MTSQNIRNRNLGIATIIFLISIMAAPLLVQADLTGDDIYFDYAFGDTFTIIDDLNNVSINFTVTSGSYKGYTSWSIGMTGGTISTTHAESGAVSIVANDTIYMYLNGDGPTDHFTYTAGVTNIFIYTYTVTTPTSTPVIVIDEGSLSNTYYLRSDTQTTNDQTGYRLDTTNTASSTLVSNTLTGDVPVQYGFRAWKGSYGNGTVELTPGSPVATTTRATDGSGIQTATWTSPECSLDLGYDCLVVTVYLNISGTWTPRATYVTQTLMYNSIEASTWTFHLWTNKTTATNTTASFRFGVSTYESKITGVTLASPTLFEIGEYQLQMGNIIGFIFFSYYYIIGGVAYLLIYMIPIGTLYIRHRTTNVILFLFVILGGAPGALAWIFIPSWAAIGLDAVLILIGSFLFWRVIR